MKIDKNYIYRKLISKFFGFQADEYFKIIKNATN